MEREGEISIEDPPATFKSFVWQHFGFPVEIRNGERVTDKTNTICKHCKKTMPYTVANTSAMQKHIQNHHSSLLKPAAHVMNVFSTAGDIVTAQRSQLLPEIVNMLIFLKKNMTIS